MKRRPPVVDPRTIRAARIAEEAIRTLLGAGLPPDPPAYAREYARAEARLAGQVGPRPSPAPTGDARRVGGLLAAALAAVAATLPPGAAEAGPCLDLAARILAGSDPLDLAAEIERALAAARAATPAAVPWRETLAEALRHLVALAPESVAAELGRVRAALMAGRDADIAAAVEQARRILSATLLGGK